MMKFILYSAVTADSIADNLGLPEYSYYFVLKEISPLLEQIGEVVLVKNPRQEVDPIYHQCCAIGQSCVFISCSPPHKTEVDLACPTVSITAWEFDNIPYETWDDDPRNDWRYVYARHGRAISLSSHTARVVKKAMGEDFDIVSIPVPVFDLFKDAGGSDSATAKQPLCIDGAVVDSRNYDISPEGIMPHNPMSQFHFPWWEGETLDMAYTLGDDFNSYLGGFYPAENWGAWSKTDHPWVLIPAVLSGAVTLAIDCVGFGANAGRQIRVALGKEVKTIRLGSDFSTIRIEFQLAEPAGMIQFLDLDNTPLPGLTENRTLALGLRGIQISRPEDVDSPGLEPVVAEPREVLDIDGVVYTSVFNPVDERKNWTQIVSAFCYAFREVEDATLILKMTQKSLTSFLGRFHYLLQLLSPFKCRVIAMHGFLEDQEYQRLVTMTSYYVGASGGEGLCLPMMEYMSAGKPAISTRNTAMEDYIDAESGFIVASSIEPGFWPHDPRKKLRTLRYRIDWTSLVSAFEKSYALAQSDSAQYQSMSAHARENLRNFASREVVKSQLREFFIGASTDGDSNGQ